MLIMWTIYKHPSDFPHLYVARPWDGRSGMPAKDLNVIFSPSLKPLQDIMMNKQLSKISRNLDDDPVIVESWL